MVTYIVAAAGCIVAAALSSYMYAPAGKVVYNVLYLILTTASLLRLYFLDSFSRLFFGRISVLELVICNLTFLFCGYPPPHQAATSS